jgi:hypothetical protein
MMVPLRGTGSAARLQREGGAHSMRGGLWQTGGPAGRRVGQRPAGVSPGSCEGRASPGFCDNAPPLPRPRSEGAQERWRTGLRRASLHHPQATLSCAHSGRDLEQGVWRAWVPGQHSPRLGPPWAESFAPLARQQVAHRGEGRSVAGIGGAVGEAADWRA